MNTKNLYKFFIEYSLIIGGSLFYALSTVLFIFPNSLLLGGTSSISVILNFFLPFSPAGILVIINSSLIILAFFILGKSMGFKTLVGSLLTTLFIGFFEGVFQTNKPIIQNPYISATVGAVIIAISSGIMFYVRSSSGGTDVIALIVQKFFNIKIGKALLITDVLIVVIGGILSNLTILFSSLCGLFIKTLGVDIVISKISKLRYKSDAGDKYV